MTRKTIFDTKIFFNKTGYSFKDSNHLPQFLCPFLANIKRLEYNICSNIALRTWSEYIFFSLKIWIWKQKLHQNVIEQTNYYLFICCNIRCIHNNITRFKKWYFSKQWRKKSNFFDGRSVLRYEKGFFSCSLSFKELFL